ncbi:MAG: DUF2871 family protein [Anaeroplasmataceae bacterium]
MKRLYFTFLSFLTASLLTEVVILISTKIVKWSNIESGRPFLAVVHTHLLILGVFFFLIQIILDKLFEITKHSKYNVFYYLFIVGVVCNVSLMLYKGFAQIFDFNTIKAITEAGSAISHTLTFTGLAFFAYVLYKTIFKRPIIDLLE